MRPSLHHPDCLCGECTGLGAIASPGNVPQNNTLLYLGLGVLAYLAFREKKTEASPVTLPREENVKEPLQLGETLKTDLEKYKSGNPLGSEREEKIWRVMRKKVKKEKGYSSYDDLTEQDHSLIRTLIEKAKKKYEGKALPKKYKLVSG